MSAALLPPGEVDDDEPPGDSGRGGRNRTLIAIAVLAVLVTALMVWIVAFSPLLGVKTVTVHGTRSLSAAQVRAAAAIAPGAPLLRLDTAAIARRVESVPDIALARVRTSYPSNVIITVTERVAVGCVASGGRYVLVDKTGDQYRAVQAKPPGLPLLAVPTGRNSRATGQAAAAAAAALSPALLARVTSVQAFDPSSITLLLGDGRVVRWGSADRSEDKARILPILLTQPGTQFDVTNPDQVVAR